MADSSRRLRSTGMPEWQLEQGKIPSENGGLGTSRRSETLAAEGALPLSAAGNPRPDSTRMRQMPAPAGMPVRHHSLRTAQLHHALDFAQPHCLEQLQAVSDHA